VHPVGFSIEIYYDAQLYERQSSVQTSGFCFIYKGKCFLLLEYHELSQANIDWH